MGDQKALEEWRHVQQSWYRVYNELAAAISKIGGIGSGGAPSLNDVRIADQELEVALVPILKRTSPTYSQVAGAPGILSAEYMLGVAIYGDLTRLRELCNEPQPDLTEALDVVSRGLKQTTLALKYVS